LFMLNVLIVDDDIRFTDALSEYMQAEGFNVRVAGTLEQARSEFASYAPSVVLVDLLLPDGRGLDLLNEFENSDTEALVMTSYPSVDSAVEGLRKKVSDYLTKPLDMTRLKECLHRLKSSQAAVVENSKHTFSNTDLTNDDINGWGAFIGRSESMRRTYALLEQIAPSDGTVFIYGESGSGKELAAESIHRLSKRPGPFLALNCGAVPENLIGNELFGHERGGFTGASRQHKGYFERASGGTLFLDEITEMPLDMQVNLLRVLETGAVIRIGGSEEIKVDVRLVAASNRDPMQAIRDKKLREDLYFRLMVLPVKLPSLREREGDIALLAKYFMRQFNQERGQNKKLTDDALAELGKHSWPGNVRELKNALFRVYLLTEGNIISAAHVSQMLSLMADTSIGGPRAPVTGTSLEDVERNLIFATLERFEGNKKLTAESLGVSLKTLYNKLKRYGEENTGT
ncbi:MAG TPA: sigma-54 dependent transcriptional regulator, partial [Gammaproteobacteria bacterium]